MDDVCLKTKPPDEEFKSDSDVCSCIFLFNHLPPFLVSFPSTNLLVCRIKESVTTYTYLTEKQLAALCPQLRRLPASNETHETDGEPLSCINDPEICMCTQTHCKHTKSHSRQTTLGWTNTRHSSVVATHTHIYTHQVDLSTGGQTTLIHLCRQASAENVPEQHIRPVLMAGPMI